MSSRHKTLEIDEEHWAPPVARSSRFEFILHDVARMRRILFDDVMLSRGITRSQWSVLDALHRIGTDGMTQVALAHHMEVGKPTICGLVDRLEAVGYVERHMDPHDRRLRRVVITRKGLAAFTEMKKVVNKLNKSIVAGISRENQKSIEESLFLVKKNIHRIRSNGVL